MSSGDILHDQISTWNDSTHMRERQVFIKPKSKISLFSKIKSINLELKEKWNKLDINIIYMHIRNF